MSTIFDMPNAWRKFLKPASFRGVTFHCAVDSRESGRRIVEHEFPKKELPYAEDMGRRAKSFSMRGYIIVYPHERADEDNPLHRRDYTMQRDLLRAALESEGTGALILPTAKDVEFVVCTSYKLTEENQRGGYCTFDMQFMEAGYDPQQIEPSDDTRGKLNDAAEGVVEEGVIAMSPPKIDWSDVASSGPSGDATGDTPPP